MHFVHGSWKKEDGNRIRVEEAAAKWHNARIITAPMPEAYGTHHSKMIVLFRHDLLTQIIILTANFIPQDFRMCQAVWRSPLLSSTPEQEKKVAPYSESAIGSGVRFKMDFIAYLQRYGHDRLGKLTKKLCNVDFSSIRAALISSVPCTQICGNRSSDTLFGWPALRRILKTIPSSSIQSSKPQIISQVSSVAAVGEKWLAQTFLPSLSTSKESQQSEHNLVFPTADSIRKSTEGYAAGASIHMKISKPAQRKQLDFLRPMLRHWAADVDQTTNARQAGQRRAAPHIKTYIRFSDESMTTIEWAMLTSANLSTQAWGSAENPQTQGVRVCSYEIGVIVWPELFKESTEEVVEMIPVFKKDTPVAEFAAENMRGGKVEENATSHPSPRRQRVVGWRMPYDLPLTKYENSDLPWSNALAHNEPDWKGRTWPGYGNG